MFLTGLDNREEQEGTRETLAELQGCYAQRKTALTRRTTDTELSFRSNIAPNTHVASSADRGTKKSLSTEFVLPNGLSSEPVNAAKDRTRLSCPILSNCIQRIPDGP